MVITRVRYVTLPLFESLTGYTVKAAEQKIDKGVWMQGREWVKAPDGKRLIDLEGYEKWVVKGLV